MKRKIVSRSAKNDHTWVQRGVCLKTHPSPTTKNCTLLMLYGGIYFQNRFVILNKAAIAALFYLRDKVNKVVERSVA